MATVARRAMMLKVWFVRGESALPRAFDAAIRDPENIVMLSVVSAWEAQIKTAIGKLEVGSPIDDFLDNAILHFVNTILHEGWHSYRIMVGLADGRTAGVLEASEDAPLFLDAKVTPEIPSLCAGISCVVQAGGCFIFEPIDERDFVLEVRSDQGHLSVRLDATDKPFHPSVGWPSGLPVEPAELLAFAEGLLLEFEQLRRSEARPD